MHILRPNAQHDFRAGELGQALGQALRQAKRHPAISLLRELHRPFATEFSADKIHPRGPNEVADKLVRRSLVQIHRGPDLHHPPLIEHAQPLAKRHRLRLVVCHENHRRPQTAMELRNLRAHLRAHSRVKI